MPSADTKEQRLLVVGAGPKAVALAAKRHVLKNLHFDVPKLIVIEKDEVAANWCGKFGFTDGLQHLGTPPHKDVGFPYDTQEWQGFENSVNAGMFAYSWHRFLIERGEYAKWVDRGRPAPVHGEWAQYLRWVAQHVDLTPEIAAVEELSINSKCWQVRCRRADGTSQTIEGDGLVITGPGSVHPTHRLSPPEVMDGATFWTGIETFRGFKGTIAIAGAGETSAAIAVALAQIVDESAQIHIYTTRGAIYSRGESFVENWRYTKPGDWKILTLKHRRDFIERTDRGVFSVHANSVLDRAENVAPKPGRLEEWERTEEGVLLHLEYDGHKWKIPASRVILPTGFDPFWFRSILGKGCDALRAKLNTEAGREEITMSIQDDLSISGVSPKLHAPMLAGIAQGPGFPNLSSLGLMSDRVLSSYARRIAVPREPAKPPWEH